MTRSRSTLKRIFLFLLFVVIALIAAWAVSRVMYPTEEQRDILAEMERQPDYTGDNAFGLLWTLDRDVPDDELDAVLVEDARRIADAPLADGSGEGGAWAIASAAEAYPDLSPSQPDREMFCGGREDDCLERVREDLDAYTALVERNRRILDRVERLADYDYLRSAFPYRMDTPLPSYQTASLLPTRRAVTFASGRQWAAVEATCRDILTWRRFNESPDWLITQMVSVAYATDVNGRLLAQMLAELPVDRPLPQACEQALSPPRAEELSICKGMQSEFAVTADVIRNHFGPAEDDGFLDRLYWTVFYDTEATAALAARDFAAVCSDADEDLILADERIDSKPAERSLWRFGCLGNAIGCIKYQEGWPPAWDPYRHRLLDYGAKLRLLGTLAWLRRHADDARSGAELLEARPDALKSPAREVEYGPGGETLRVALYEGRDGETNWSIPLPPALHSAGESD